MSLRFLSLVLLFVPVLTFSQHDHPADRPGIAEIKTWEIGIDAEIPENKAPNATELYDEQGRILNIESEYLRTTFTYGEAGMITRKEFHKQMGEEQLTETYQFIHTDSMDIRRISEYKLLMMADGGYKSGAVDHRAEYAHIPAQISCEGCDFYSEWRYTYNDEGRKTQAVKYWRRNSQLKRIDIYTYEYVGDSLCIKRMYEPNYRDELVLSVLTVQDSNGCVLFNKYFYDDPIDSLDNESLRALQPRTYRSDDQGNWIERIEADGKTKTVRVITYR